MVSIDFLAISMRSGSSFCATRFNFQLKRTILDPFREKSKLGLGRPVVVVVVVVVVLVVGLVVVVVPLKEIRILCFDFPIF